jgi:acetyl-CoA acetyltransferase
MGRHPYGRPWGEVARAAGPVPPGVAASALAARAGINRGAQDAWAARSVLQAQRAHHELRDGAAAAGVQPVGTFAHDELLATRTASSEELAAVPPLHDLEGTVTAGNSAPPADGAAALVVTAAGLPGADVALAEVSAARVGAGAADDPGTTVRALMHEALDDADVALADVVRIELFEPYAAVALAVLDATGVDERLVNPDGGALAIGAPTATGPLAATVTLAHALAADPGAIGLVLVPGPGPAAVLVLRGAPYAGSR